MLERKSREAPRDQWRSHVIERTEDPLHVERAVRVARDEGRPYGDIDELVRQSGQLLERRGSGRHPRLDGGIAQRHEHRDRH